MHNRPARRYFHGGAVLMITMTMFAFWPLGCSGNKESRAIAKVGRHLERIHDVSYAYSLKKTTANAAAASMHKEVDGIRKRFVSISDTAAIKEPLTAFLARWTTPASIEASLLDGRSEFMAQVTAFYMRGLVERREGGRTLFPARRP